MAVTGGSVAVAVNLTDNVAASANNLNPYQVPVNQNVTIQYTNGTGINQVNKLYGKPITLSAAPASVDLTGVTCTDLTTGFSFVRELVIINPDPAHTVKFGDDGVGTNLFLGAISGTGAQYTIQPQTAYIDQHPLGTNGYASTGSTKNVRLDPGANTVTVYLIVAGS